MDALTYLLCKAAEEAAEVAHALLKAQFFGLNDFHPKKGKTNIECIIDELNDLNAVIGMLRAVAHERHPEKTNAAFSHLNASVSLMGKRTKVLLWAKRSLNQGRISLDGYKTLVRLFGVDAEAT